MRRARLIWLRLRWPREVTPEQVLAVWRTLAGVGGTPIVIEALGNAGRVHHRLGVEEGRDGVVIRQLRSAIPGVAIERAEAAAGPASGLFDAALAISYSTRRRAISTDDLAGSSRTLLSALSAVGDDEYLLLQWVLGAHLSPAVVPTPAIAHESSIAVTVGMLLGTGETLDAEERKALATKRAEAGWRAIGRLAVAAAGDPRRRQLLRHVMGALRTLDAPGVRVFGRSIDKTSVNRPGALYWRLRLNVREIAALSAVPVGTTGELPVDSAGSRQLPPSRATARQGRVVAEATYPGRERPLALGTSDSLRNLHILGPIGTGKSNAALSLIEQDLAAGRGLVVVEPKGDLIRDVLARVPDERLDDIVVIDPTDPTGVVVGLNPLAPMGRPPELVADQLLNAFHVRFADAWGQRTADIMGNSFATLARVPGMSLAMLAPLLTNAAFRRRVVSRIHDPLGLEPWWETYESWSEPEKAAAISPTLNKWRNMVVNPMIRGVIGQATPRFQPLDIFTKRRVLLVNLATGLLGPEAAATLGSLVLNLMWQATLGRSAIDPGRRHACFFYLDEFQTYLNIGHDVADSLSMSRGLGVGFVLSHQHLSQMQPAIRSAVLANARNRLCFSLSPEDAKVLAPTGHPPAPEDFTSLGAYECYVQLVADNALQPWCSARTLPPSPPKRDPESVLERSRARYGVPRSEVDAAIERLVSGRPGEQDDDLSPRRRRGGTG